jgi:hypothetical protein
MRRPGGGGVIFIFASVKNSRGAGRAAELCSDGGLSGPSAPQAGAGHGGERHRASPAVSLHFSLRLLASL